MRLCTFSHADGLQRLGALVSPTSLVDVNRAADALGRDIPESLSLGQLVQASQQVWSTVRGVVAEASESDLCSNATFDVSEVNLSYPFRPRANIVKAGGNARLINGVSNADAVDLLRYHTKSPASCAAPGSVISWRSTLTSQVYVEPQLIIVVGSPLYFASPGEAMEAIVGYSVGLDFRAWDLMQKHGQWPKAISLDGFFPWGPYLVTPDEIDQPDSLDIWLNLNGERVISDSTGEVLLSIGAFLSEISGGLLINAGDVFMLGVPEAIGFGRNPYRWCEQSDVVSGHVEGVGEIAVTIDVLD